MKSVNGSDNKDKSNVINFRLDTNNTSYIFKKTKYGHLEHVYYGDLLRKEDKSEVVGIKRGIQVDEKNTLFGVCR